MWRNWIELKILPNMLLVKLICILIMEKLESTEASNQRLRQCISQQRMSGGCGKVVNAVDTTVRTALGLR